MGKEEEASGVNCQDWDIEHCRYTFQAYLICYKILQIVSGFGVNLDKNLNGRSYHLIICFRFFLGLTGSVLSSIFVSFFPFYLSEGFRDYLDWAFGGYWHLGSCYAVLGVVLSIFIMFLKEQIVKIYGLGSYFAIF